MSDPLFTVVVPTHDRPDGLRRAVKSVLDQRESSWEVIVVDDASSVAATSALGSMLEDSRVIVVRQDRSVGAAAARNIGVERARGSYVAFLDDDDTFFPDKLAQVRSYLEHQDTRPDVVYHDLRIDLVREGFSYRNAPDPGPITFERMLTKNLLGGSSMLIARRDLALTVGGFPTMPLMEDYGLLLELTRAGAVFAYLPEVLGSYERVSRIGDRVAASSSARTLRLQASDAGHAWISSRYAAEIAALPLSQQRERTRHFLTLRGYRQALMGVRGGAARDLVRAFGAQPSVRGLGLLAAALLVSVSPHWLVVFQGWVKQRSCRSDGRA